LTQIRNGGVSQIRAQYLSDFPTQICVRGEKERYGRKPEFPASLGVQQKYSGDCAPSCWRIMRQRTDAVNEYAPSAPSPSRLRKKMKAQLDAIEVQL
jgi:hypothetical protein